MTLAGLWPFAVLAAAGSVHCAGMCGGFAVAVGGRAESEGRSRLLALTLYSVGKTITYVTLALLVVQGLRLGGVTDAHLASSQRTLAVVAGGLLVALGVLRWTGLATRAEGLGAFGRAARAVLAGVRRLDSRTAAFGTGLVSGYLPCGLTLGALALAAGSRPADAALGMAVFGAATTPALAAAGLAPGLLAPRLRHVLARGIAPALVLLGLVTTWRGLAAAEAHGLAACPACEATEGAPAGGEPDAYDREP